MIAEVILGVLGEASLGFVTSKGAELFKAKGANKELAEIGEAAVEEAIRLAPTRLANDLRSKEFIAGAFVPMLEAVIRDPSELPNPEGLASQFIEMFAARFTAPAGADEALVRVFETSTSDLKPAFEAMLVSLRTSLYASKRWREIPHLQATEEIRSGVAAIRGILEANQQAVSVSQVDVDAAKRDASVGSDELRAWPKDIDGHKLFRPELERLHKRLETEEAGTAILIGEAGSGKSALLAELTELLEGQGVTVFAIKADTIPADVETIQDIGKALGMSGSIELEISALAQKGKVVVIIDQLDAVSDVMDRSSTRMRLLLRLIRQIRDQRIPAHIVVSSRPFEAAHDARFQQLKAEEYKLSLPSIDQALELLGLLGVKTEAIDKALHETLRRPFALKLFVGLLNRGVAADSLQPGQLLDRWLATADLGRDEQRQAALTLMEALAAEMIETETLWRPADTFESKAKEALARCEACGLVVRSGQKIGFNHQSWLDDFQAKGFRSGAALANYAWQNQDSLFVRATVLRSLERFRLLDESAYIGAVNLLLTDSRTRRHLKHLVVDIFSANSVPLEAEGAWIEALIRSDHILAVRGLSKIVGHWDQWRQFLLTQLPTLMRKDEYQWSAVQILAAEARIDSDHSIGLMVANWNGPEHDGVAFRVIEQAGVITPKVEELIQTILKRTQIDQHSISHFVTTLRADGRKREAARVTAIWLGTCEVSRQSGLRLYEIEKLAEAAPLEFAEELLPWFVEVAARETQPYREGVLRFPKSQTLPWDWDFDRDRDSPFEALRDAMKSVSVSLPNDAVRLIAGLTEIEVEEVQELVAETLAANGSALANEAWEYLLADERRFQIGDAHVNLAPSVSGTVAGLASQELIEAIAPHLSPEALIVLRDRIEGWSLYSTGSDDPADLELKRARLKWIEENRLELLERLPQKILTPRRQRQIREWRAINRKPLGRANLNTMAGFVGSPMSTQAMTKASDDAIVQMLSEVSDVSPERIRRRSLSMEGGVIELSRAFGAFAVEQPERAMAIAARRLVPELHEHAAGELVHELSKQKNVDAVALLALIHALSEKGFRSRTWKNSAAWALSAIAKNLKGLNDQTVALLESWLENDPALIEEQIDARLKNEEVNRERNKKEATLPNALLFDGYGGGIRFLPQNNYTILSAIFHGLLARPEQDCDTWLSILERHAEKPEDPHIWTTILLSEGRWLFWADRSRVEKLLTYLWGKDQQIFDEVGLLQTFWGTRAMVPNDVLYEMLDSWLASDVVEKRQSAAEFVQAGLLVAPDDPFFLQFERGLPDQPSEILTGRLFSGAAAWREDDEQLRARSHAFLMKFAPDANGDQSHAISGAVDRTDRLIADELTQELVLAVANNANLLSDSLNGRFADGLQSLLLYPGFDELVMHVTEKVADLILAQRGTRHRGMIDQDFVHVTIALQRNDGPLRKRAMDVYERLLDAGVYGAEEAAKAATGR